MSRQDVITFAILTKTSSVFLTVHHTIQDALDKLKLVVRSQPSATSSDDKLKLAGHWVKIRS